MRKFITSMKKIFLTLFAITLFISCKDEKSTTTKQDEVVEKQVGLKVTLRAKVINDDAFQLFFREDTDPAALFQEENSVWVEFKGSETEQDIVFELSDDVYPMFLRLDTGLNPLNVNLQFSSMTLEYKGKTLVIDKSSFLTTYFAANESIKDYDAMTGSFNVLKLEGGTFDPFLVSGETLKLELEKLYK